MPPTATTLLKRWFRSLTITVPQVTRSPEQQAAADAATADLALYHYDGCVFCTRVHRAIAALGLSIETRDVLRERLHYRDLLTCGGRTTVPCLRIGKDGDPRSARWLFESRDIIAYLVENFGATTDRDDTRAVSPQHQTGTSHHGQ